MEDDSGEMEYDSDVEARVELTDFKYSAKTSPARQAQRPKLRKVVVPKRKVVDESSKSADEAILAIDADDVPPKPARRASSSSNSAAKKASISSSTSRGASKQSKARMPPKKTQVVESDSEDDDDDEFLIDEDDENDEEIVIDDASEEDDDFEHVAPPSKKRRLSSSSTAKKSKAAKKKNNADDDNSDILAIDDLDESPKPARSKKKRPAAELATKPRSNKRAKVTKAEPSSSSSAVKTEASAPDGEDAIDLDLLGDFAADEDEFGDAAFEEMDEKQPLTGEDDLNIVIDAPGDEDEANPKKRKRATKDVKVRRATKEEKEAAIALHNAHLLSLIGSYLLHSRASDNKLLQAAVLSIAPQELLDLFCGAANNKPLQSQSKKPKKGGKKKKQDQSDDEEEHTNAASETAKLSMNDLDEEEYKTRIHQVILKFKELFSFSGALFPVDLTRDNPTLLGKKSSHPIDIVYRLLSKLATVPSEVIRSLELQEAVQVFAALSRLMNIPTRIVAIMKPVTWKLTNLTLTQAISGSKVKRSLSESNAKDLSKPSSLEDSLKNALRATMASLAPMKREPTETITIPDSPPQTPRAPIKSDPNPITIAEDTPATSPPKQEQKPTIPLEAIAGLIEGVKEEETQQKASTRKRRKSKGAAEVEAPTMWLELYCAAAKRWIHVDILRGLVDEPLKCTDGEEPVCYVFAFEDKLITDVTKRYSERWSQSLRQIPDVAWLESSLASYNKKFGQATDDQLERILLEMKEMSSLVEKESFPTSQEQYRHHPLYVLEKYVGKYDILWPPDQPALGHFKNQPIYPRKNVYHLHTREKWLQYGKQVKDGEQSVKQMRKITYKKNEEDLKESEYFGEWQTEPYQPPPIVDGIVPKNEYGNVYLFKPEMMPIGGTKINLPGIKLICKRLGVDFGEALVGWEHVTGRFSKPQFDGVIVAAEQKEMLLEAWQQDNERRVKEEARKTTERALKNWMTLVKMLMAKNKLKSVYASAGAGAQPTKGSKSSAKSKKKASAAPKASQTAEDIKLHEHSFPREKWQQISDTKWLKVCDCGFSLAFEQM